MSKPGFVDGYLSYLLARASQRMSSEFHRVVESQGLSLMEWRVMASLSGKDTLSINALSDIVLAKQPTVTKLIGRMQEAGWVRRVDGTHDRRLSMVSLTPKGVRKVTPLLTLAQEHEAQVLAGLGPQDIERLKQTLAHLIGEPVPDEP